MLLNGKVVGIVAGHLLTTVLQNYQHTLKECRTNPSPDSAREMPDAQHTEALPPPPPGATRPGGNQNFMPAVHDQLAMLARLTKGKTIEALEVAARSRLLWLATLLVGAILAGLLVSTTIARVLAPL